MAAFELIWITRCIRVGRCSRFQIIRYGIVSLKHDAEIIICSGIVWLTYPIEL